MPFRPFYVLFPEVAMAETRSVCLPVPQGGLPAGWYSFKEMFCDEPDCDCRRAFFLVESSLHEDTEAVIAWGWEDLEFYERWMKCGDREDAEELIGPILNPMSPATSLAPHLLELFREVLLQNPDYIERVKQHYAMFREKIERGAPKPRMKKRKKRARRRN